MQSHLVWEHAYSWRWWTALTQSSIKGRQHAYLCGSVATQQGYTGRGWVMWELHSQTVVYKEPPPELAILSFDLLGLLLRWVVPSLYLCEYDLGLLLRHCPDCKAQALILLCGLVLASPWQFWPNWMSVRFNVWRKELLNQTKPNQTWTWLLPSLWLSPQTPNVEFETLPTLHFLQSATKFQSKKKYASLEVQLLDFLWVIYNYITHSISPEFFQNFHAKGRVGKHFVSLGDQESLPN